MKPQIGNIFFINNVLRNIIQRISTCNGKSLWLTIRILLPTDLPSFVQNHITRYWDEYMYINLTRLNSIQFKQFILPIAQNINNSGIYSRGEGPTEAQSPQMIRLDRLQE